MNAFTIRGYVLAVGLIAPAASADAVGQHDQGGPYAGWDYAVLATAQNEEIRPTHSIDAMDVTVLPARGEAKAATAVAKFSTCGTLTFSADGQDTSFSSNQFADPVLGGVPSFVCRTY